MPSRLLLGLRVATSVAEIILDSESELESELENKKILNILSISTSIFLKICNSAERGRGTVDASERSRTVYNDDFEPLGTLIHVLI